MVESKHGTQNREIWGAENLGPFTLWPGLSRAWLSSGWAQLKCCFTSTETVGLLGMGAQDSHLDFHTAPELWFWAQAAAYNYIHLRSEPHVNEKFDIIVTPSTSSVSCTSDQKLCIPGSWWHTMKCGLRSHSYCFRSKLSMAHIIICLMQRSILHSPVNHRLTKRSVLVYINQQHYGQNNQTDNKLI